MAYKKTKVRFLKNGRKYITHTTRYGRNSKYNTKSYKYNGKLFYL